MVRVVVFGGTGTVGRAVVAEAVSRGHSVVSVSRHRPRPGDADHVAGVEYHACDLYNSTTAQLDAIVAGSDAIVDSLDGVSTVAQAIFRIGAQQIADAAERASVSRVVLVSSVGCDQSTAEYFAAKTDQEGLYLDSSAPVTVVRFTVLFDMLHDFALRAAKWRIIPTSSRARFQPMNAHDVATVIVDALGDTGDDRVVSIGGPQIATARELTALWLRKTGRSAVMIPVPLFTAMGRYLRFGSNLVPDARVGTETFNEWLTAHSATRASAGRACPNGNHAPSAA
ncbi:Uncharacterized conserved protein YbjT, contains NAD(P)-binding and DUF2867 domains [Paramicrobacterium humi]|uniref:Uncharacterized conserved protein YbjT, contains NAD(P)-binding and DUF2867 domains n=1 Tax=Paramicrobacterium humi TaxID=640635 RepID=A0A1H4MJC8_9MICO|nr:NAD(P)H-binding protein [Microbacterium humi]SEB83126.1 Uncharacterized conserved protein YbjT, contains NAD(P)-binding and DUF2867 domains [Microbacterium humi]